VNRVAALLMLLALAPWPAHAQDASPVPIVVLTFHPNDGVDPLGFAADGRGTDPFALRYGPLVADKGRFDFPYLVADGVLPIEAIPDPSKPYLSALGAYGNAVQARATKQAPVTLRLESSVAGDGVVVGVEVLPRTDLAGEDLHLRLALVEDHVHYQPPPGLTNGVTDHRFTVRAYADLGAVDFNAAPRSTHRFALAASWDVQQLSVAAWLQQDAPSPRFDAREVLQATQAPVGRAVEQTSKGVLVEMLSATWCDPCLYGDRALEQLAVDHGVASPGQARPTWQYLEPKAAHLAPVAAAIAAGLALVLLWRRTP
jgi:thiol-disulfide isomerase/thioredoxin